MPTESAAGGRSLPRPTQLEPDRTAFLAALNRVAELRGPSDPIGALLLDPRSLVSWDRFASLVFEQSARHSLIAAGDRLKIYTRHILDSLNPLEVLDPVPRSILDIGSGAGFPGIPLAIAWPASTVTLLESRRASLEADSALIDARRRRLENRVNLLLALGGGLGDADPAGDAAARAPALAGKGES